MIIYVETRGFDRGWYLEDCRSRCHPPRKTGGKNITGERAPHYPLKWDIHYGEFNPVTNLKPPV